MSFYTVKNAQRTAPLGIFFIWALIAVLPLIIFFSADFSS